MVSFNTTEANDQNVSGKKSSYDFVYSQQPSHLMEFNCNFHFMLVCTFKLTSF